MLIEVVEAIDQDLAWITKLFAKNSNILGNPFWLESSYGKNGHRLLVVREKGFLHYRISKDGLRTVKEIAVAEEHKKRGIGRALIDAVGKPVTLKTDSDNSESNLFYVACGFLLVGRLKARSGKLMNVYQRW